MTTETSAPAESVFRLSLGDRDLALILALTERYSQRFQQEMDVKIRGAKSAQEEKDAIYDSVVYQRAISSLQKELVFAVENSVVLVDQGKSSEVTILITMPEHKYLSLLFSGEVNEELAMASGKYTLADVASAKHLVAGVVSALKNATPLSAAEVLQVLIDRYGYIPGTADAAPVTGFGQTKVGLA